jgi:hypothetical protein
MARGNECNLAPASSTTALAQQASKSHAAIRPQGQRRDKALDSLARRQEIWVRLLQRSMMQRMSVLLLVPLIWLAQPVERSTDAVVVTTSVVGARSNVALSTDGVNFLMAFEEERSAGRRIYLSRISGAGVPLDGAGLASFTNTDAVEPALFFDGNVYLLVFRTVGQSRLYGRLLTRSGAPIGGDFLIAGFLGNDVYREGLRVGADAGAFVVTWTEGLYPMPGQERVLYARVSAAGQVVTAPTQVPGTARQLASAVASVGSTAVIAWTDFRNDPLGDIHAVRLSGTGALLDSTPVAIAAGARAQGNPAVVALGNNALIGWEETNGATGTDLLGTVFTSTGTVSPSVGVLLVGGVGAQARLVGGVSSSGAWLAWREEGGANARIALAPLVAALGGLVSSLVSDAPLPGTGPAVACVAAGCVVAINATSSLGIVSVQLTWAPSVGATSAIALPGPNTQRGAAVAGGGGRYLLAWSDSRTDEGDIYGLRVGPDGAPFDAAPFVIAAGPGRQFVPAVAFTGTDFLVAWSDRGLVNDVERLARVPSTGAVGALTAVLAGIAGPSKEGGASRPALACGASNCLLAWRNRTPGFVNRMLMMRVSFSGTPLDPAGILISRSTDLSDPAVAPEASGFAVVNPKIYGTEGLFSLKVGSDGTVVLTPGDLSFDGGLSDAALSSGIGQHLAGWVTGRYGAERVHMGFIDR